MTSVSSATATASSTSSSSSSSTTSIFNNFNTFLTLLTTQLKNQDPSSPMDTDQFTQQLVQYASVEQLMSANETLGSLLSLQQASEVVSSASLVGKKVEVTSSSLSLQDGSATLNLPSSTSYTQAQITISNSAGATVYSGSVDLSTTEGTTWTWDGKNIGGTQLADGAYKVSVTGINASGGTGTLDFTITGTATSVQTDSDTLQVSLGDLTVDYDKIVKIAQ